MKNEEGKKDVDQILTTMNIYLNEMIHRDKHMWSQNYKFFFASLTFMLLPNLTQKLGFEIPNKFINSHYFFPIIGVCMSFVFLYVSLGHAKRFLACSKTYRKLILQLPENLRRISLDKMPMKFLNHNTAYVIPILMFIALLVLGFILIL